MKKMDNNNTQNAEMQTEQVTEPSREEGLTVNKPSSEASVENSYPAQTDISSLPGKLFMLVLGAICLYLFFLLI